jgi:NADPH2:quinone reductase
MKNYPIYHSNLYEYNESLHFLTKERQMKAVIATTQGTPEVLQLVELNKPQAGAGQVLVRVIASAVNHIDIKVRKAKLPMTPDHFPAVLQSDFSGVIEEIGAGVARFRAGDAVYGFAGGYKGPSGDIPGALSEYIAVDARLIALKPRSLDFRQAAALPLVAVTAWLALHDKVRIDSSTKLLVQGGTGGVGHIAVQLAKAAGATVFVTVANEESVSVARELGADVAIVAGTSTPQEIVTEHTNGRGFDVIFDTVGGAALDAAFQMIRPTGDIVTVVGAAPHNLAPLYLRGANLHTVLVLVPIMFGIGVEKQGYILDQIRELVDAGHITPILDPRHFSLHTVADAHRLLEAGQSTGKLVIDVGDVD